MIFDTTFRYHDRETKAKYVWLKYQSILKSRRILDVGADECFLSQYLDEDAYYWGVGLGSKVQQIVNLETDKLPFDDASFDCVLCLDVLEHIENIHEIFDHLCRVTREHLIIALPNPWSSFYTVLRSGFYDAETPLKFYGLPIDRPIDRHKWFFAAEEAERFLLHRASQNDMQLVQLDYASWKADSHVPKVHWIRPKYQLRQLAWKILFSDQINHKNLYASNLWAVFKKQTIVDETTFQAGTK